MYTFCFDPRFSLGNRCRPAVWLPHYGHVLTPAHDERYSDSFFAISQQDGNDPLDLR